MKQPTFKHKIEPFDVVVFIIIIGCFAMITTGAIAGQQQLSGSATHILTTTIGAYFGKQWGKKNGSNGS